MDIVLKGHVGRLEKRETKDGSVVLQFSVAESYRSKNRSTGEWKEDTEWRRCVMFDQNGSVERTIASMEVGDPVMITGYTRPNKWWDKEKQVEVKQEEIVVTGFPFVGKRKTKPKSEDASFDSDVGF